jgi:hypothetical protein
MITRTPPWAKGMRKLGPGVYFRTSEVTRQESERAGEVERQAVRLAEAHALKGK